MTPTQMVHLASEEEAKIVETVFLKNASARKTVVFTSPDRGAGCSCVVARIARSLVEYAPDSTCVVDANLRWPAMHDLFSLENTRGLVQAFREDRSIRDYAQQIPNTNLWVLPSGGTSEDAGLFESEAARTRFAELSQAFDFVLIDTVAMKVSPDAGVLGQLSDGVVLVLAANSTTRDSALNTKVLLDSANVPIEGAVLNKRTDPIPDKVYRYL